MTGNPSRRLLKKSEKDPHVARQRATAARHFVIPVANTTGQLANLGGAIGQPDSGNQSAINASNQYTADATAAMTSQDIASFAGVISPCKQNAADQVTMAVGYEHALGVNTMTTIASRTAITSPMTYKDVLLRHAPSNATILDVHMGSASSTPNQSPMKGSNIQSPERHHVQKRAKKTINFASPGNVSFNIELLFTFWRLISLFFYVFASKYLCF